MDTRHITDFFSSNRNNNDENGEMMDSDESATVNRNQQSNIQKKDPIYDGFNEGKTTRRHKFCQNIVIINGKELKCQYHKRPERYDRDHNCFQFVENEKEKIDKYISNCSIWKCLNTSRMQLIDHFALVCAELNFSIKSITSPAFTDLLYRFIKVGQESNINGTFPLPNKIYKPPNRNKLRDKIISLSNSTLESQCQIASLAYYISVAIDGGTVAHNHFVDVMFNDTFRGTCSFLFDSYVMKTSNAEDYFKLGIKIIDEASLHKIKIISFVGDRLPSQVKGLDHLHPNSLQNTYYHTEKYRSVLFVPCICHVFNRSLVNSIKKSLNLQKGIEILNSLQVLLRKPVIYSIINKFVPSLVETRWGFLFDVAFWAVTNKKIINTIFVNSTNKSIKKEVQNFS